MAEKTYSRNLVLVAIIAVIALVSAVSSLVAITSPAGAFRIQPIGGSTNISCAYLVVNVGQTPSEVCRNAGKKCLSGYVDTTWEYLDSSDNTCTGAVQAILHETGLIPCESPVRYGIPCTQNLRVPIEEPIRGDIYSNGVTFACCY